MIAPKLAPVLAGIALAILAADPGLARRGTPPRSRSQTLPALADDARLVLPPIDAEALAAANTSQKQPGPLRYASPIDLALAPQDGGQWDSYPDGTRSWRLLIDAPGSTDLSLGFTRYRLPPGATLHVSSPGEDYWEGPYSDADNRPHRQLWIPVIPGDRALIELWLPATPGFAPELRLGRVGRGFLDLFHLRSDSVAGISSGACNNDVVCPEGDPWRDPIRAAAVWGMGASTFCSGTIVDDVAGDCRPFFLTANHCGVDAGNAPSVVVYWNFEASVCGGPRDGSLAENQTGATFRAALARPDFALIELDSVPDPASAVFYAGWDRSGASPGGGVAIHHPNTDEKAISFNTDPLTTMNSCIGPGNNTHWRVDDWEDGTTEPGSSGSALFDPVSHLVVGTLSGGNASCSVIDYDCFGKLSVSWDMGATPATRLQDWLDPGASGAMTAPGRDCSTALLVYYRGHRVTDDCPPDPSRVNAILEPGEDVFIAVDVASFGNLTNVRGTLTSPTPGVTIVNGSATWPDLLSGAPERNRGPDFVVRLADTLACYTRLDFDLDLIANEGGPFRVSFGDDVGLALRAGPDRIPDPGQVVSALDVTPTVTLNRVDVHVVVAHGFVGDLSLTLRSPSGTRVALLDRPGMPASQFGCGDANFDITFSDASTFDPEPHCLGDQPWYSGAARPIQPLAALIGEPSNGRWELTVDDAEPNDSGEVIAWDLVTDPPLPGECRVCAATCAGQVIAVNTLFLTKAAGGMVQVTTPAPSSPCASGVQVRMAATARPTAPPGLFPNDPAFADVSTQDLDPGLGFRHVPPPGNACYLAVEDLSGAPGPSGRYGY